MTAVQPFRQLPRLAQANLAALAGLLLALSWVLWPAWRQDPELTHGRFVPLLFAILLYESRRTAPPRFVRSGRATAGTVGLAALGLVLVIGGGLYAAVLDWSHALVQFLLASGTAALLGAGWLSLADSSTRWLPFNWSAAAALLLWPLAAPIPPGTYSHLSGFLQQGVTSCVLGTLQAVGIAAFRHGNVIELARTSVGVSEACSGIRSLIACLVTGLFFSGCLVHRTRSRVLLITLAPLLALVMNFVRSLFLTLLANAGVNIADGWHDATGYTILGVTAVCLSVLALKLERRAPAPLSPPPAVAPPRRPRGTTPQLVVASATAATWILGFCFALNTHPFAQAAGPAPNLRALLPGAPAGWVVQPDFDLQSSAAILQTDILAERTYTRPAGAGLEQLTLYIAYWRPGQAPVSLVSAHTPDACWPGAGWEARPLLLNRQPLPLAQRTLPVAECRYFTHELYPQYVWYWHLYAGRAILEEDPHGLLNLLHIAWHYGYRHDGDQLFVRVSSNRPWAAIATDSILLSFFQHLQPFGL